MAPRRKKLGFVPSLVQQYGHIARTAQNLVMAALLHHGASSHTSHGDFMPPCKKSLLLVEEECAGNSMFSRHVWQQNQKKIIAVRRRPPRRLGEKLSKTKRTSANRKHKSRAPPEPPRLEKGKIPTWRLNLDDPRREAKLNDWITTVRMPKDVDVALHHTSPRCAGLSSALRLRQGEPHVARGRVEARKRLQKVRNALVCMQVSGISLICHFEVGQGPSNCVPVVASYEFSLGTWCRVGTCVARRRQALRLEQAARWQMQTSRSHEQSYTSDLHLGTGKKKLWPFALSRSAAHPPSRTSACVPGCSVGLCLGGLPSGKEWVPQVSNNVTEGFF